MCDKYLQMPSLPITLLIYFLCRYAHCPVSDTGF